jgi:SHS2 domain-containing protein
MKPYHQIEHTGDIGIQIFGSDLQQLFEHAGFALLDLITDLSQVRPTQTRKINIQAGDREELLVNWLSELNYIFQTEYWLACQFKITDLAENNLAATVAGEPRDPKRHPIRVEIKAVTFHRLQIMQDSNGYTGQVIFDV